MLVNLKLKELKIKKPKQKIELNVLIKRNLVFWFALVYSGQCSCSL